MKGSNSEIFCFLCSCPACKVAKPIFDTWARGGTKGVHYAYVDCRKNHDLSRKYSVTGLPQFLVFQNKNKMKDIVGADMIGLRKTITQFI